MAITNRRDIFANIAKGSGYFFPGICAAFGVQTAAAAGSGFYNVEMSFNGLGTTTPGTLVGFPIPPGITNDLSLMMTHMSSALSGSSRGIYLGRVYRIGAIDLTATGDKFTHDAATFPILRTQLGQASQALSLIPITYVTTALTTTAAVFQLQTNAGAAGYKNQDGSSIIGAKTFTFPSATTSTTSGYQLRLEDGDSAITDIIQVKVTTAAATGACDIYGLELLGPLGGLNQQYPSVYDSVFGGLSLSNITPGTATSGTATSYLVVVLVATAGINSTPIISIMGAANV